jgi:hypothetical protein
MTTMASILWAMALALSAQPAKYKRHVNEITQDNSPHLVKLLKSKPAYFGKVLANPEKYRVQIIYSQVNRTKDNRPYAKHHTFRLDTNEYFFPASMVKIPAAATALEKMNELNIPGLNKDSKMVVMAQGKCQSSNAKGESSFAKGYPTLVHYIKDALIFSGNNTYDRLYEFCGQEYLNTSLWKKGYTSAQIVQRYGRRCTPEENRQTNEMHFYDANNRLVYSQPMQTNPHVYRKFLKRVDLDKPPVKAGVEPRTAYDRNFVHLKDLHEMLMAIMIPRLMPPEKRFNLTLDDYRTLHKYMSMYPTESTDPEYSSDYYHATRMKYLLYGSLKPPLENVRIFNKVGLAWGFAIDCAFFVDFETKTEFFLSAVIYCGSNYYSVGMPFLQRLGEVVLEYERNRNRKYLPQQIDFYKHDYTTY